MSSRQCPHCGASVSHKADECFMCGYQFNQPRRLRVRIPWADIILGIFIVALVAIWWRWDNTRQILSQTPSVTPTHTATPTITPTITPTPTTAPTPTITPTPTPIVHTVQSGDTYLGIANLYGIELDTLLTANGLKVDDIIQPGQTLIIPAESGDVALPTPEPLSGLINYAVEPGDSVQAIAIRLQLDPAVILENNDIADPNHLQPGQVLIIPMGPVTPEAMPESTVLPTPEKSAPILISPINGSIHAGKTGPLLRWVSAHLLARTVWYQINLSYADPHLSAPEPIRSKGGSLRLDDVLRPPADAASFEIRWWVRLVSVTRDGNVHPVSPPSAVRHFEWR